METHDTQGDCWGLMRLSMHIGDSSDSRHYWGLMRLRDTWGLMRLRKITVDS